MKIKVCGITNLEDAEYAISLGVDALGFILFPASPRYIELNAAVEIIRQLPPFVTRVAVTVNMTDDQLKEVEFAGCFDRFQFHGDESLEQCRRWRSHTLIKAIGLPIKPSQVALADYPVSALLIDKASTSYGGTGETVDWKEAANICRNVHHPVILAGGLNSDNIEQAIKTVQPYGVDVCSGVEASRGKKDHEKLKEFVLKCRKSR
ncbi:MAG: phosphoribosylanthranilate isomerase [Verrucomicrobiota bacterium]